MTFTTIFDVITALSGFYNSLVTLMTTEVLPGITMWMLIGGVGLVALIIIKVFV